MNVHVWQLPPYYKCDSISFYWPPCICLIVWGLAGGDRLVQDEHFELLTVADTSKMAEIWNPQNVDAISKKNQISRKRLELRKFCKKAKMFRITFCIQRTRFTLTQHRVNAVTMDMALVSNLPVFLFVFWPPCICSTVLGLAGGERLVQNEHFELSTVAETSKIAEIRNFQNFDKISKKSRLS